MRVPITLESRKTERESGELGDYTSPHTHYLHPLPTELYVYAVPSLSPLTPVNEPFHTTLAPSQRKCGQLRNDKHTRSTPHAISGPSNRPEKTPASPRGHGRLLYCCVNIVTWTYSTFQQFSSEHVLPALSNRGGGFVVRVQTTTTTTCLKQS